jgi:WD40 repeat protein
MQLLLRSQCARAVILLLAIVTAGCSKTEPEQSRSAVSPRDNAGKAPGGPMLSLRDTLDTGAEIVSTLAISADGQRAALRCLGGKPESIQIWDLKKKEKVREFKEKCLGGVALTADGRIVAYAGESGEIYIRQVDDGTELQKVFYGNEVYGMRFSPAGDVLVAARDSRVTGWDSKTGKPLFDSNEPGKDATSPGNKATHLSVFFEGGKKIASNGKNHVYVWDVPAGKLAKKLPMEGEFRLGVVGVSPDGKRLATQRTTEPIKIWDLPGERVAKTIECSPVTDALLFLPDGNTLVYTLENEIILENLETGARQAVPAREPGSGLSELALSADGKVLISGGNTSGKFKVWDIRSRAE